MILWNGAYGQKPATAPTTMPYGIVDTIDLKLTECPFEKDANAMVLFDRAEAIMGDDNRSIKIFRHKRIKIFNTNGKDQANIRLDFNGRQHEEEITDVEAQTINFDGNAIRYTSVDKKLIYHEKTDKDTKSVVFSFPDFKAGSIIEYVYNWESNSLYNWPDWKFQSDIPTRYSEIKTIDGRLIFRFNHIIRGYQRLTKDSVMRSRDSIKAIWALSNVNAYKREPFMEYDGETVPRMEFISKTIHWNEVTNLMLADNDFGKQLNLKLEDQQIIVNKINRLASNKEKVESLFNLVKNNLVWNKVDRWYTVAGVESAWKKKLGNSTEINLILYHFLKLAGLKPQLIVACPKDYDRIDSISITFSELRKTLVYCPLDASTSYVLDASNRYNIYSDVPYEVNGVNAPTCFRIPKIPM